MESIHHFITRLIHSLGLSESAKSLSIGITDLLLLGLSAFLLDFILKNIFSIIARKIVNRTQFTWDDALYENKIFNSLSHAISISFIFLFSTYFIPKEQQNLLIFTNKIIYILFILVFLQFIVRFINAIVSISTSENNHRTVAVRSFAQLLKIITYIFGMILLISVLLGQDFKVIIGSLSAITAIILLLFKDTILGFVSGVQIASTKMVKVGDWIYVPKYKVDGTVVEINLVSAKIRGWDKTVSSVPTYDLISSSVKNYESMQKENVRRIKRSLIFNTKSFRFLQKKDLEFLKSYELIAPYLSEKIISIDAEEAKCKVSNMSSTINSQQLTNIGVFRKYAELYLKNHAQIAKNETLLVRQLDLSPHGLPLEIYCFTNTSDWIKYEKIQADIFDHLLTSAHAFNLELVQILSG